MYFIFFQWFIIFVAYTVGLVTLFYIILYITATVSALTLRESQELWLVELVQG